MQMPFLLFGWIHLIVRCLSSALILQLSLDFLTYTLLNVWFSCSEHFLIFHVFLTTEQEAQACIAVNSVLSSINTAFSS